MSNFEQTPVYRFILLYRREPREVPDATETWRGWIQAVPTGQTNITDQPRLYFESLDDIPAQIRRLMKEGFPMSNAY